MTHNTVTPEGNTLYNIAELVKATGVSRSTLNRLRLEGMPYVKGAGQRKYVLEEVKAFIAERNIKRDIFIAEGGLYDETDIISYYRIGTTGKIRKSNTQNAVVLFSDAENPYAEYSDMDYFDDDENLHFIRTGRSGDKHLSQNHHNRIHLFMKTRQGQYAYRGLAAVCEDFEKHEGNEVLLHLLSEDSRKTCIRKSKEAQSIIERKAENMDLKTLYTINDRIAKKAGTAYPAKNRHDPRVTAYVIARANGQCQLCGKQVNEKDIYSPSRLVCYHGLPLQKADGKDDKYHAAALCDNCYARIHGNRVTHDIINMCDEIINRKIRESETLLKKKLKEVQ